MTRDIIRLLRPKHWIKNGFVLIPLIFSFQFLVVEKLLLSLVAFASFCLAASAVYVANDIIDRGRDRLHPQKRHRPIAAGRVSVGTGVIAASVLAVAAIVPPVFFTPACSLIIVAYLLMNLAYSLYLKHLVLIDVFTLAAGFVLRIAMGAAIIQVPISEWLILVTIFLSLFLGFGKRHHELTLERSVEHRGVLGSYSPEMLLLFMAMSAVLTIVVYTFYTIDPAVAEQFNSGRLVYSIPAVVFGVFRYFQLVAHEKLGGDVAEVVTGDIYIILAVGVWAAQVAWAYQG